LESFNENPKAWLTKFAIYHAAPKIIAALATAKVLPWIAKLIGMDDEFAKYLEKIYSRIPEHYKSRYNAIPLYIFKSGRTFFLKLPTGHMDQVAGAIIYHITMSIAKKEVRWPQVVDEIKDLNAISESSLQPLLQVAGAWWEWAGKRGNPRDAWTGWDIIPRDVKRRGRGAEAVEMLKWSWDKASPLASLFRFYNRLDRKDENGFEKVLDIPIIGKAVGAYFGSSDKGLDED